MTKSIDDATPEEWDAVQDARKIMAERPYESEDVVNHPAHYNTGGVECIEYIQQQLGPEFRSYLLGNLIKYIHRHQYKGKPVEDLRKARWYLDKLIQQEVACELR